MHARPTISPRAVLLGAALALAGCASTTRTEVTGAERAASARPAAPPPIESFVQGQSPPAAKPAAPATDQELAIAVVSGESIDVRAFLTRIWLRSNDASSDILDRLVVESLVLLEAERQEIAVSQTKVDERCEEAWKALTETVERQGGGVSVAEHLRRKFRADSEYYRRQLRREAILQMLAERVVRSWACSHDRCEVRLVELADQAAVDGFNAGLAAGRDFADLAKEFHRFREKEPGGARITLIKNPDAELARVAFNTPEGKVAGPLPSEAGRQLMMRVEKLVPSISGTWKQTQPAIEQSLAQYPVDDLEFAQWSAEMAKSYSVDMEPFFKLIGVSH